MTNKRIQDFEELKNTQQNKDFEKQLDLLVQLQRKMDLNFPHTLGNSVQQKVFNITTGIHNFLQRNLADGRLWQQ
jgi:uncharacterized protein YpuA (DUF1002 family)